MKTPCNGTAATPTQAQFLSRLPTLQLLVIRHNNGERCNTNTGTTGKRQHQHGRKTKRFAAQLQLTLNAINRNPFFASVRYDDIRCAAIKKFPYLVHYHINEDELVVTIIAVYSSYKEPFW